MNDTLKELKTKVKFSKVKEVLKNPKIISYLNILQEQYAMCPIDKAAKNIGFICKKYFVQVILKQLGLLNTTSNNDSQVNDSVHNVLQQQNNTLDSAFRLENNDEEFKCNQNL